MDFFNKNPHKQTNKRAFTHNLLRFIDFKKIFTVEVKIKQTQKAYLLANSIKIDKIY